jgi:hypothetical protein
MPEKGVMPPPKNDESGRSRVESRRRKCRTNLEMLASTAPMAPERQRDAEEAIVAAVVAMVRARLEQRRKRTCIQNLKD